MREVQAVQASLHSYPKEVSRIPYHVSRITCQSIILYCTETYLNLWLPPIAASSSYSYCQCHILLFLFLQIPE
jgi:hypothetical protein